ncbi:MAG TPA: SRPBCC family protein [Bryobacteraceae bacterium]
MRAAMLGAGAMYFIDPGRGRRRRALVRDQGIRLAHRTRRGFTKAIRDLANRRRGLAAAAISRIPFRSEQSADYVIEARVRSRLGRLVSHPHAVDVAVHQSVCVLSGDVLSSEAGSLLHGASRVPGVSSVRDQLHVHEGAADFPALQGAARKQQPPFELLQESWTPAARLLTGGAGAALAVYGLWKGGIGGAAAGIAAAGLLTRSLTNMDFRELVSTQAGGRRMDIQKTINIAAPVEAVYEFWSNFENFPRFMPHLKEVRETGPGRSHWIASGPPGFAREWDAEITELVPKELLVWRTVSGSPIEMEGRIRFEPNDENGTRLSIQVSYQPVGGAAGYLLARLFGSDPKHAMDDDLVRLKSLLEVGKTRNHGEVITRSKLPSGNKRLMVAVIGQRSGYVH